MKEEDRIINNIHGIEDHKTIIQQDIIKDHNYKWRSHNNNTWNHKKKNYAAINHQGLALKRIELDGGQSLMERRKHENKKAILLGFIACNALNWIIVF